jgi:hypothetical protein
LFQSGKVLVEGFPWCAKSPIEIGIGSLTAKILCTKHNNDLSPIDQEGAKAFSTIQEINRVLNIRRAMKPHAWKIVRHRISGTALERWCLKTLINICCDREFPIGSETEIPGRPSERLIRIAYGEAPFDDRAGLYLAAHLGMRFRLDDSVSFAPLLKHKHHVEGGLFTFRGINLLLFLEAGGPPSPNELNGVMLTDLDLGQARLSYHHQKIEFKLGRYVSHTLLFDW